MVAKELLRYDVDIAALSEIRFADKGQLTECGGGYTFIWSGHSSTERRGAGVGFAIKSHLARKLVRLPEGMNDRLMTFQIPLGNKKSATLMSAYAPTMTNPDDVKDKFYEDLDILIAAVPQSEKVIVLGDFNARVGTDLQTLKGNTGRQGTGNCNGNGLLFLNMCATQDLTNTLFRLPTHNKTSWMRPLSRHWHLIDYVISWKRDRQDVRVTKVMCGAECWTDHRLIVSRLRLRILPIRKPQGQKTAKRLNVSKLKTNKVTEEFLNDPDDRLPDMMDNGQDSTEEQCAVFRDAVYLPRTNTSDQQPVEIKTG